MTENENIQATLEDALYCAKSWLGEEVCEECRFYPLCHTFCDDVAEIIVQALEEIQQYRAIGTIKQFEWCKDASHWKELFKDKLEQYEAIGTVEEFKAYKQGNCTNNCKHYDSTIEYVRNKAIDEFAHQLKETLNQEFPSNYESTRPYFSLENARLIVDDVAEQMKAGGIND